MGERIGAARARELGDELRQYRELLGISSEELAKRLGWSASKVSRIEHGITGMSEIDVVRYAAHCGLAHDHIDALLEMCREPGPPGYWLSRRLSSLIFYETTASSSVDYGPLAVPGLLQTEEYATEFIAAAGLKPAFVKYWVDMRMERQLALHSREFAFYIHEYALHLPVGGNRLMNEQLLKLVLLGEQPQLTIRVVPAALGARSYFGPEFVLYGYARHRPLVYVPSVGLFLEDPGEVTRYQEKVAGLSEMALSRGESREWLAALASEFDRPEDSPDGPDTLAEEQLQHGA